MQVAPTVQYLTQPYYIVTLTQRRSSPSTVSAGSVLGSGFSAMSSGIGGPGENAAAAHGLKAVDPFADVKLGRLIGRGAFGSVFKGTWDGKALGHRGEGGMGTGHA